MFRTRTFALAFLTTLGLAGISASAFAGNPTDDEKPIVDDDRPRFPMSADEFQKHVEKRVQKGLDRLNQALERHKLPAEVEQAIRAEAARVAGVIRAAAAEAEADGSVTKEEAKHVREVARQALKEAREKFGQYAPKHQGKKQNKGEKGKRHGKRPA